MHLFCSKDAIPTNPGMHVVNPAMNPAIIRREKMMIRHVPLRVCRQEKKAIDSDPANPGRKRCPI